MFFPTSWCFESQSLHRKELCSPFFWRTEEELKNSFDNWRIGPDSLGASGGFDLKSSYLWNTLLSTYDFHLPKQQFLHVIQWLTPHCHLHGYIFWEVCYMLCRNQSVSRSRALPSLLACPSLTMIPSSMERTRGLIKNKGDLFFWHVKIFHFFFSPRLFLIHTSMKNGLNRPFFFFHLASLLLPLYFELSYIIKFST